MTLDVLSYGTAQNALKQGRLLRQRGLLHPNSPLSWPVMATPPAYTRGVANAASTITSAVKIWTQDRGAFTYRAPSHALGLGADGYFGVNRTNQLLSTSPAWAIEWVSDAPLIEVILGANTTPRYRLVVDQFDGAGFRLTQANAFADPGTTSQYNDLFDWTAAGGRKLRHYRLEAEGNFRFNGVNIGPQDSINRVPHEDLTLFMGDSFTEPTVGDPGTAKHAADGYVGIFGRALGLKNCCPSGSGGTGYINPGTGGRFKFRDRFMQDIVPANPARLFFAGGINDANREPTTTAQMIYDEAMLLFALAKGQLPYTEMGVFSPFVSNGNPTASVYSMVDALKQAATDNGMPFYDVVGMAPPAQRTVGHLTAASTGVSNVQSDTAMPVRSWARVGGSGGAFGGWNGTLNVSQLAQVTSSPGTGPYTINFASAIPAGIPIGAPIVTVGHPWVVGNGKNGTPNNTGSADLLISSDATHPTEAGHMALGRACLQAYLSQVAF